MKTCSVEGCSNPVWSKGACKYHAPKPTRSLRKKKQSSSKEDINQMREFFMDIWRKRRHYSEVSDTYLGKEPLSIYFHHILPKEKFKQAQYDEANIILLTLDEHSNCESDMYRYEEINKRRESLLKVYENRMDDMR